jgi:hypothetical protein
MTSLPEPDEVDRAARVLKGPLVPPDEEILEAVHDGLVLVPAPPINQTIGIPRQRSERAHPALRARRHRNG